MRFTKSKDGKLRATIKIAFRIDLDLITCAVQRIAEDREPANRPNVEKKLRDMLRWNPPNDGFWDEISKEDRSEAKKCALALFPELGK